MEAAAALAFDESEDKVLDREIPTVAIVNAKNACKEDKYLRIIKKYLSSVLKL